MVDGGCNSTTGHFLSLLRHHGVGIFIGEETGGSSACNGGYKEVKLNHTGIVLLLPHTTFIAAAEGLPRGQGIEPDYSISASISDVLQGIGPVMERAKSLIDRVDK